MADNKLNVQNLLKKFEHNGFGAEFPQQIKKLEELLETNVANLENLEQVINADNPADALNILPGLAAKVEPLADFFGNFKDGKSMFDCLPLDELEKQEGLNKEQKEAAENIANASKALYEFYNYIRNYEGKDLPFEKIDNVLDKIPALDKHTKHIPVAQTSNFQQLIQGIKTMREDYSFYKANVDSMNEEQAKQCKDGLKAEAVGLAVAGSAIAVGVGLSVAVACSAPIPGVNVAVAGVAAAVIVGFMIYKIGHKMNAEVKNELTEGLEVTDRKSLGDRIIGSIGKMMHFSTAAKGKIPANATEVKTPAITNTQKPLNSKKLEF